MKNKTIHASLIPALIMCAALISCKPQPKDDSEKVAKEHNEAKANDSREAKFLMAAAEIGMREVELSKNVQTSNGSKNVKEIGRKMEKDHDDFLKEIKKLAKQKSISIPDSISKNSRETIKKLDGKSDEEFDKQYCEIMAEDLKEEVKKFKSAAEDIDDIDIKNWANKSLPILRDHLDHAMTCKESFKNKAQANK